MSSWTLALPLALCPVGWVTPGIAAAAPGPLGRQAPELVPPVSGASVSPRDAVWIENTGQWPGTVRFAGNVGDARLIIEADAILLDAPRPGATSDRVVIRMSFEGACLDACIEGLEACEGTCNFFVGSDPQQWHRRVQRFRQVRFRGLYSGIDLVVDAEGGRIKYDLYVEADADLSQVVVRLDGTSSVRPSGDEILDVESPLGTLVHSIGASWQTHPDGEERFVQASWVDLGRDRFGLFVPGRDSALPLVIDPELAWSTYLGSQSNIGSGDVASAVTTDSRGDVVVVGFTNGFDFPHTPGTYQSPQGINRIPFVTKLRGNTGAMVYSSLIGGTTNNQRADAVAVDSSGRVTVGGYTTANDFPTTPNAFDTVRTAGILSGFVSQFTASGDDLVYSTFIEGPQTGGDVRTLAVHPLGGIVAGGVALGPDFPTTAGAAQTQFNGIGDGYLLRLDATGSSLLWSTLLGGTGSDEIDRLVLDDVGVATVTGITSSMDFPVTPGAYQQTKSPQALTNLFVARLNPQASAVLWASYLGGSATNEYYVFGGIGVDVTGSVTIGGTTNSPSFPATPGTLKPTYPPGAIAQGFITRFDSLGQHLIYSTFLGDSIGSGIGGFTVDSSGVVAVSVGSGPQFPVTPGAYDTSPNGDGDIAIARVDPRGRRLYYSTFLGGPTADVGTSVSMSTLGRVTVAGYSYAPGGYPTTPGAFQPTFLGGNSDVVVTSLDLLLQGVEVEGTGTPSCHGPLLANATEMPQAGAAGFGLYLSGAPSSSRGLCLISTAGAPSGVPFMNATLWLDPASIVRRLAVLTDAAGFAETSAPLAPGTTGLELWAQYLMRNAQDCPSGGLVASHALHLTVQ